MTAAEQLRQEFKDKCPVTKEQFISAIVTGIKEYGRATFICDSHITETKVGSGVKTIRLNDEHALVEYARSEGFRDSIRYNKWGAREIIFTL